MAWSLAPVEGPTIQSISSTRAVSMTMYAPLNARICRHALDSVDPRQHQIEHDHIRVKLPRQRDRLLAVAGGCDLELARSKLVTGSLY